MQKRCGACLPSSQVCGESKPGAWPGKAQKQSVSSPRSTFRLAGQERHFLLHQVSKFETDTVPCSGPLIAAPHPGAPRIPPCTDSRRVLGQVQSAGVTSITSPLTLKQLQGSEVPSGAFHLQSVFFPLLRIPPLTQINK